MLYSFFCFNKNVGCSSASRPRYPNIYDRTKTHRGVWRRLGGSFGMSRPVSRVLSLKTTIYLGPPLPAGSSHLLGTAGPACASPYHGVAPDRVYSVHVSPRDGWALTPPFHHHRAPRGSLFLLHLSEGHPWRALPAILALWSPDFPHAQVFALCPRSFSLLTRLF